MTFSVGTKGTTLTTGGSTASGDSMGGVDLAARSAYVIDPLAATPFALITVGPLALDAIEIYVSAADGLATSSIRVVVMLSQIVSTSYSPLDRTTTIRTVDGVRMLFTDTAPGVSFLDLGVYLLLST